MRLVGLWQIILESSIGSWFISGALNCEIKGKRWWEMHPALEQIQAVMKPFGRIKLSVMGTIQCPNLGAWALLWACRKGRYCGQREEWRFAVDCFLASRRAQRGYFFIIIFYFIFWQLWHKNETLERHWPWKTPSCDVQRIYNLFGKCTAHWGLCQLLRIV